MKIAVIGVKEIPSNQGEIERYCQEFYPRIAARGHQVDLFVQSEPDRQPWFSVGYYYNVRVIALSTLPKHKNGLMLNSAIGTVLAGLGGYDIIHIHGTTAAWFSWFPQLFSSSKIVVTAHQLDTSNTSTGWRKAFSWLLAWIEKTAIENADEVIVVSKALGDYYQQKYNIHPRYIPSAPVSPEQADLDLKFSNAKRLAPEATSDDPFSYGTSLGLESQKYILCLGELNYRNRLDLLLKAFQKLNPDDWKLVLAGEIGNSMQYAIELLGLAKDNQNIIFINELRGKHLTEIVNSAGLLVVPGDGTDLGLPLTVLEAMQEEVPVLANDSQIYRELMGKNRGLLYDSENLDSLTEKLRYVLDETSELSAMVHDARAYIAVYHNWDRVTYGNLSLYLKITEQIDSSSIQPNV